MSKYTTELRFICESLIGLNESKDEDKVKDIVAKAAPVIFDFDFPIYDESHRLELETKIIKHYYTREICAETYGRWKLFLDERMNKIMPYYNELYKSATLEFDPLSDYKIVRTGGNKSKETGASNTKATSNSNTNGTNRNLFSDTPQGSLQNIENETYLTNATKDVTSTDSSNNTSTDNTNNTDYENNYNETVQGLAGGRSYSALLNEYRKTIINIDSMIVDELNDLFMNIW